MAVKTGLGFHRHLYSRKKNYSCLSVLSAVYAEQVRVFPSENSNLLWYNFRDALYYKKERERKNQISLQSEA